LYGTRHVFALSCPSFVPERGRKYFFGVAAMGIFLHDLVHLIEKPCIEGDWVETKVNELSV